MSTVSVVVGLGEPFPGQAGLTDASLVTGRQLGDEESAADESAVDESAVDESTATSVLASRVTLSPPSLVPVVASLPGAVSPSERLPSRDWPTPPSLTGMLAESVAESFVELPLSCSVPPSEALDDPAVDVPHPSMPTRQKDSAKAT
jgi:hypothetical protein